MSTPEPNPFSAARPVPPPWVALLGLVVIVLAAFAASVRFGFINYDDPLYITENPHVNTGIRLGNLKWALTSTGDTNLWHPLTFFSHQLDVSLFGLRSGWHHAMNVLWHAAAAAFLFLTALKLTKSTALAFFTALIWAIHPEKIQSVAWLSERKDVLSGAFFFASLYLFTWWRLRPEKSPPLYGSSLLFFILALLSKPSVVPLPLLLFLLYYLDPKRIVESLRVALPPLAPFAVAALVVSAIVIHFQSQGSLGDVGDHLSVSQRTANIVVGYVFYLRRFFWPSPAQLWFVPSESALPIAISAAALAAFVALVMWLGRKEQLIIAGAAIFTILWLPVSGLVSVSHYFVADRYSYLPQIGLVFMLVGLVRLATRSAGSPLPATLAFTSFSALLIFLQQRQLPLWKNSETLFGHEMAVNPRSLLAPIHYGEVFAESDPEKALAYYTKAHLNDPEAGVALTKMGMTQKRLGRTDEALESFQKGTRVATPVPVNWTQLLILQVELKKYGEAAETVSRGLVADPGNWEFLMNSGNFHLIVRRDAAAALELFLKAHAMRPADPRAIEACAECHRALGNTPEARRFENLLGSGG